MKANGTYLAPRSGGSSPWGRIDGATVLADGIVQVSTASHGGIHLSSEHNAAMPVAFRRGDGWYEEDCEWALVALIYPQAFSEDERKAAHTTVKGWMPDAYEVWAGVELQPGESHKKDERIFLEKHAQDWVVISAFGAWHDSVPKGWVGVYAMLGGVRGKSLPERTFLVPEEEYRGRSETLGMFVCDEARHPVWRPDEAKDLQEMKPARQVAAEEEEPESPRP